MNLALVCAALLCLLGVCICRIATLEHAKRELERDLEAARDLLDAALGVEDAAQARFGVLSVETGNFLGFHPDKRDAEGEAAQLRQMNPDMPADAIAVVEFDEQGMPA